MPMFSVTITDDLLALVERYQQEHDISRSRALAELAAIGAKTVYDVEVEPVNPHGDVSRIHRMAEYVQCQQCGGWNTGIFEGRRYCADCGHKQA